MYTHRTRQSSKPLFNYTHTTSTKNYLNKKFRLEVIPPLNNNSTTTGVVHPAVSPSLATNQGSIATNQHSGLPYVATTLSSSRPHSSLQGFSVCCRECSTRNTPHIKGLSCTLALANQKVLSKQWEDAVAAAVATQGKQARHGYQAIAAVAVQLTHTHSLSLSRNHWENKTLNRPTAVHFTAGDKPAACYIDPPFPAIRPISPPVLQEQGRA